MMRNTWGNVLVGIGLSLLVVTPTWAKTPSPDRVREEFAHSKDLNLQLAAEALGDDAIMEHLESLKKSEHISPSIRRVLEQLKKK